MHADRTTQPGQADRPSKATQPVDLGPAIIRAVAYSDIFDFPLTVEEIARYLEHPATVQEVRKALSSDDLVPQLLHQSEGFHALAGRQSLNAVRASRARTAQRLWPRAIRYGRLLANMPFVRMVAVTGSLAMNNPRSDADIDYLVVTEPGRLWLCRALVIGVVRLAALQGIHLCPNYFLALDSLVLQDQSLYTAREVAQMIPLSGLEVYRRFRHQNRWVDHFLPNAQGTAFTVAQARRRAFSQVGFEWLLRGALGRQLERWEMNRKIEKLARQADESSDASFTAGQCKGHFDAHHGHTMRQFSLRSEQQRTEGVSP